MSGRVIDFFSDILYIGRVPWLYFLENSLSDFLHIISFGKYDLKRGASFVLTGLYVWVEAELG